jgi:transketolase
MGAIANGMAAHFGCLPYTATFLIFSDYMRPPMRLAALSHLHVIHVFTHDSVALGEDGPTHQPIEQLAGLRAIPNLTVIRPADANETAVAWQAAIETRDAPVSLVFTRQAVPTLDRDRHASASGLRRGAYVLETDPDPSPQLVLIASGSEVHLIVEAAQRLRATGLAVRCVSMPSWELFDAQPREYRDSVLPPGVRARLAVEAGATQGWWRYVGDAGDVLGIDHFGASAPGDVNLREFGFTVDEVCRRAQALLSAAADGARR